MPDFDCLECVMPVTLQSHALTMLKKTCLYKVVRAFKLSSYELFTTCCQSLTASKHVIVFFLLYISDYHSNSFNCYVHI